MPIQIGKKDKSLQNFNPNKIVDAIRKSADRACVKLTQKQEKAVVDYVCKFLIEHGQEEIEVAKTEFAARIATLCADGMEFSAYEMD